MGRGNRFSGCVPSLRAVFLRGTRRAALPGSAQPPQPQTFRTCDATSSSNLAGGSGHGGGGGCAPAQAAQQQQQPAGGAAHPPASADGAAAVATMAFGAIAAVNRGDDPTCGGKAVAGLLSLLLEPRHERIRRQVLAGHLQQLQGQVPYIAQDAEAQHAIAHILISEVHGLRGQSLELRARLDDAATALRASDAAAAAVAQQVTALQLLCVGLCGCVMLQALLNWFQSGSRAAAAASGGGGAFLFLSGPCWGVALTAATVVYGLLVLLSPQMTGAAAANGSLRNLWFGRWDAPELKGELPDDAAGGDACPADGRGNDRGGALKGERGSAGSATVLRRSSLSFGSSKLVHGGDAGGEELSVALNPSIRRSITEGLYAGGTTLGQSSVQVVQVLTAPMRLHFRLAGKQHVVRRCVSVQQSPGGLVAVASGTPSRRPRGDDTAHNSPLSAHHDGDGAATITEEDSIGSGFISAAGFDRMAVGGLVTAAGNVMKPAASAAAAAVAPQTAAAPPGPVVPRLSDFDGWPDAPVLLAFHTGLIPGHSHTAAAPEAAGAAAASTTVSGRQSSSGAAATAAVVGDSSSASLLFPAGSGKAPIAAGSLRAMAAAAALPPAPTPRLVRLRVNGMQPIRVDTDLFCGELVVLLKGLASSPEALFNGKKRMSWVAMQGRFKKPLALDAVVTGQEFGRPFKRLPAAWFVERVLLSLAKQISPSMRVGPLSAPALLMPLIASAQLVNVSKPGSAPPIMECTEDVRLFCPSLASKGGSSQRQQPISGDARQRHFSSPRNRVGLSYDTEHVWTFHFWQRFVDLVSYRLDFGYTYDLIKHLDGQPLQIMAKDADSGGYLFNVLVWNERLLGPGSATTAAGGE